jgi:LacI family transcriptional regulator
MSLTLEKIAEMSGVSRSTVSRVINAHPHVSDKVRERVWQVIQETGYQPDAAARSLVTRRSQIVGVIIPEAVTILFSDPFFVRFLNGVTSATTSNRYHLMLSLVNDPAGEEDMYRRVVRGGHLEGAVIASTRLDDPLIPRLLRDRFPFVLVGRHPDRHVSYVDIDNVSAARMAVEHLIRLGHRRIATITGPVDMASGADRLQGYCQALAAHGLAVDEALVVHGDFTESSGRRAAQELLPACPSAIFAANDSMAIGAVKTLRRAHLRMPDDVALVGFDDMPIASAVEPALSTVRQPIERLGEMATELLLDLLDKPRDKEAQAHRIILTAELVVRDSCGALVPKKA